jgi:tRNA threonylcarbamoyladenosine biosynthesis protein TsaE
MSNIFYSLSEISKAVDHILIESESKFLCFYGSLGAGKTTLIKAIIKNIGATASASSPTFGLVHDYSEKDGSRLIYHLDCYRLNSIEEALDIGLEEYLYSQGWVFLEWPERIEPLLPEQRTEVRLTTIDPSRRKLEVENVSV